MMTNTNLKPFSTLVLFGWLAGFTPSLASIEIPPLEVQSQSLEFPTLATEDSEADDLPQGWIQTDRVILEGLDKITARVFTAQVYTNQQVRFGTLEVYVRAAYKSAPEETPESACFLEVFDCKPQEEKERVFAGWMFASNPALSALDHAVYDLWIKEALVEESPQTG